MPSSHLLFLILSFLLTLTLTSTSAVNTTTSAPTNTLLFSPTSPISLLPPPPSNPQEPKPTPQQETQFNSVIDAILHTGDFSSWANLLSEADPTTIPFSATFFVPDNTAFLDGTRPPCVTPINFLDPLLFPYHIVPRRFSFTDLQRFPTGARLPTLLAGKTLLITNNSAPNFTINGAKLSRPNIYQNSLFSAHGVGAVLDYNLFGDDVSQQQQQQQQKNDTTNSNESNGSSGIVLLRPAPELEFQASVSGEDERPSRFEAEASEAGRRLAWSWFNLAVVVVVAVIMRGLIDFLFTDCLAIVNRQLYFQEMVS